MNEVNFINAVDGNQYLVKDTQAAPAVSSAGFDEIFNGLQISDSLEKIFDDVSKEYGVNINILKAVAQAESAFDPDAVSCCGAQGIMQLMPFVSEELGVTDPFDARQSITGGAKLLSGLLDQYNGNVTLALAAYNAGSGSVSKYGGVPPYDETVNYINKINDILGGALSDDSRTIEGAQATKFAASLPASSASAIKQQTAVEEKPDNSIQIMEPLRKTNASIQAKQEPDSILSYENYMYVINTYKNILQILFGQSDKTDSQYMGRESFVMNNSAVSYDVNAANDRLRNLSFGEMIQSDAAGMYQMQASVISPLAVKLLNL